MTTPARGTPEWHAFVQNARDRYRLRELDIKRETAARERDPAVRAAVARNDAMWNAAFDRLARQVHDAWAEEGYVVPTTETTETSAEAVTLPLELYGDDRDRR